MNLPNKKIIAAIGMAGSGKSELIKYLQKEYKWPRVYFGDVTFDRMKEQGIEINYETEKETREKIREELGMGAYATLSLPKIEKHLAGNNVVLVESLYSWSEYKILKEKFADNFIAVAIYASPQTRFQRLTARTNERPMNNIEEFIRRDYSEIENIEKGGPIARADYTIINEDNLQSLHDNIDITINKILQ